MKEKLIFTVLICFGVLVDVWAQGRPHPLDPLTEAEIRATTRIVREFWSGGNYTVNYIVLKEPPKKLLLPYFLNNANPPSNIPRRATAILMQRHNNAFYDFTVNLDRRRVEGWVGAPSRSLGLITPDEMLQAEEIAKANRRVRARCEHLGYANMSLVTADPWSLGYVGDKPSYQRSRLVQLYFYGKNFEGDNEYAHPFDFLAVVDLRRRDVINIEDLPVHDDFNTRNREGRTVPRQTSNYDPDQRDPTSFRRDLRPVKVSQDGKSFTLSKNEIKWQKYQLRVGFNGREGLVLYMVNYNDGGKVRPLFYRMSLAEMFVPYGDPRPPYHRKAVYDEGQYGVGFNANSLKANLDCVGEVIFVDAVLHNLDGEPVKLPKAVCVREEDAGVLWKHTDFRTGKSSIVRSQRLALSFVATVANYDYLYSWNFYQDGSIEYNVKLSGILSTNLLAANATPGGHGAIVKPQVNAQYHQHFFSLRLDTEIDGNKNTVSVADVVAGPGSTLSQTNPYGQGFTLEKKMLKTAGESRTNVATEKSRKWIISNSDTKNPNSNSQTGWKLVPYPSAPLLIQKDSPIHPQVAWMDYHTWVTPYKEDQLFPGGFWLNNSGLPEWVREDENANIADTDVVLWHNFGISHIPRTEDFPVMPVESCSVFLKPYNFFLENPALDVRAPKGESSNS